MKDKVMWRTGIAIWMRPVVVALALTAASACGKDGRTHSGPTPTEAQDPVRRKTAVDLVSRLPPAPLVIGINRMGSEQEILDAFGPEKPANLPRRGPPAVCVSKLQARLDAAAVAIDEKQGTLVIVASGPDLRQVVEDCLRQLFLNQGTLDIVDEGGGLTRYTREGRSTYAVWEGRDTVIFGGAEDPQVARALAKEGGASVPPEIDANSLVWAADLTGSSGFQYKFGVHADLARRAWLSTWTGDKAGMDVVIQMASPTQVSGAIAIQEGYEAGHPVRQAAVEYRDEAVGDRLIIHMDMEEEARHTFGDAPSRAARNLSVVGFALVIAAPGVRHLLEPRPIGAPESKDEPSQHR